MLWVDLHGDPTNSPHKHLAERFCQIKVLLLDIVHAGVNTADLHGGDLSNTHAGKDRMIEFSVQISVITCGLEAAADVQP